MFFNHYVKPSYKHWYNLNPNSPHGVQWTCNLEIRDQMKPTTIHWLTGKARNEAHTLKYCILFSSVTPEKHTKANIYIFTSESDAYTCEQDKKAKNI